jgi:hypothetical protein
MKYNYCAYLIAPLLNLNLKLFGDGNLVNCYLNGEIRGFYSFIVEVEDTELIKIPYKTHKNYTFEVDTTEHTTLIKFTLNPRWNEDIALYRQGKYSELSELAKIKITKFTIASKGQPVKVNESGEQVYSYDFIYLALKIHPESKKIVEQELQLKEAIPLENELWDKPNEESYGRQD